LAQALSSSDAYPEIYGVWVCGEMDMRHLRRIGIVAMEGPSGTFPTQAQVATKDEAQSRYMGLGHSESPLPATKGTTAAPQLVPSFGMRSSVAHGKPLPGDYAEKVPASDAQILRFFLAHLMNEGLGHVPLFINGGYVRDLLLGKMPDDLDLSLGLWECPETVTVDGLLERSIGFAAARQDLGIVEVKTATILSNQSRNKQVDTFKGHFTNEEGRKTEVDVMPTIGDEVYEDGDRVPVRDQRGTPEQDALRRDLTIGAMLLRVDMDSAPGLAAGSSNMLRYTLLDFYGGVVDLQRGVLRSPFPPMQNLASVRALVLRTNSEEELAKMLSILEDTDELQILWWAKVLMDDPVRICRALRFSAKFSFSLHQAFWQAAPFALHALRSKVAGSRKDTEYQKIAGYGFRPSVEFFELAFTHTFGPRGALRLAPALFGGQDAKGSAKTLSDVRSFDMDLFRGLAANVEGIADPAVLIGSLLAGAIFASELEGDDCPATEFQRVCQGMCVSNIMRDAGLAALQAATRLAAPTPQSSRLKCRFAVACGVSEEKLSLHVQVWEALQFTGAVAEWPTQTQRALKQLACTMLSRSEPSRSQLVVSCLETLDMPRCPIRGSVLNTPGVLEVPGLLRKTVLSLLEVGMRLLRRDAPLEDGVQLARLFEELPGFAEALAGSTWYEDDGKTLREEFRPLKRGREAEQEKQKKGKKT